MRAILLRTAFLLVLAAPDHSLAAVQSDREFRAADTLVAHGGGCRKSSPPGQCCHMQKSTGKVHCH